MIIENARIRTHDLTSGSFRLLVVEAPGIAASAEPGQFVHIRVPNTGAVLRRPFSIFKANGDELSILYKLVGAGTLALAKLEVGESISVFGPLGNSFPAPADSAFPVLVAGGYGAAALRLLAERLPVKGAIFIGAGCGSELLCVDEFKQLGWQVRAATEDGSKGERALVTAILENWLDKELKERTPEFFACGPRGLLKALAALAERGGWKAWLSMEQQMACGVGACLGCAQKVKANEDEEGWNWARVCADGPIFESRKILWS